ncbi:MAG: hypothetical protein HOD92_23525 [Deltaproteobacteria bacterium]|jgi:hypothetical protein|nr:hypothetical protein [Deltaproteobacteria bacterium]MBT4527958.1 hypothetical protein [Deltaproteobacteria bacterium]
MKKLISHLFLIITLILIFTNSYAVEHIVTYPDKSQLFRCEMHGSVFKVHVKMIEIGRYRVVVIGKGTSGNSGLLNTGNYVAAARWGCGGE